MRIALALSTMLLAACGAAEPSPASIDPADAGDTDSSPSDAAPPNDASDAAQSCSAPIEWREARALPEGRSNGTAFVAKGWLYYFGGFSFVDSLGSGFRARMNDDGSLGAWEPIGAKLPTGFQDAPSVVLGDTLYLIGGSTNGARIDGIYRATIGPSGDLGSFTFQVASWGAGPNRAALSANNEVFVFGGKFEGAITDPLHTKPDADGRLGTPMLWATTPTRGLHQSVALLAGRTMHLLGGRPGPSPELEGTDVHYSMSADRVFKDFSELKDAWTVGKLPVRVTRHGAAAASDRLFLVGGMQNGAPSAKVFTLPLDAQGAPSGAWSETTNLPEPRADVAVASSGRFVYAIGGRRDPKANYGKDTSASVFVGTTCPR